MEIAIGKHRIVLLYGKWAVKIARMRPFRCVFRVIVNCFSVRMRARFRKSYGNRFWDAVQRYIAHGVYSNRTEYKHWKAYQGDPRLMPTTSIFLKGIVVVQIRGERIFEEDFRKMESSWRYFFDADRPGQFGRLPDGRTVLLDYGDSRTCRLLRKTALYA